MSGPYVVASQRPWNAKLAARLTARTGFEFVPISHSAELVPEKLAALAPRFVFLPHWSERIPQAVWRQYECVIFHMTDVPYGRGGSPLQNLIAQGHEATVMTALRCVEEMDAGPVYSKRPLSLGGSAEEIFIRADEVIEEMIVDIVERCPTPSPQEGDVTMFRRRKPAEGNLEDASSLAEWFDKIRMLDATGYPPAFIEVGEFRLEFSRVARRVRGLAADVVIRKISEKSDG